MALKKTKSIVHGGKRVSEILEAHQLFFSGKDGGVRADFGLRKNDPEQHQSGNGTSATRALDEST